jgi:hypothetical protein
MKKFAAIILAVLFGTGPAFAHNMKGGSTSGLFGLKAEYVHILLNPLPVYGLSMGVFVLAATLLVRSKSARNIGLLLIVICAASAWPVLYYGQHGYNHLYPQLDTESQQWLDVHMERAERFVYAFYLTALLGIAALLTQKKFPRATKALTGLTLAAGIASLGIGGWISRAGGEVSHSEFRSEGELPPAPAHEHEMHDMHGQSHKEMQMSDTNSSHQPTPATGQPHEGMQMSGTNGTPQHAPATGQSHKEMQMSDTNSSHQSAAANRQPHEGMQMSDTNGTHQHAPTMGQELPNTPEGIWTEIHKHQSALQSAVQNKKLDEIHPHAVAVKELTKALVDVVHPDHKAAVQSGVDKINLAVSDLHQAAHADDQAAAEANFKRFDDAVKQLEEQMKKQ